MKLALRSELIGVSFFVLLLMGGCSEPPKAETAQVPTGETAAKPEEGKGPIMPTAPYADTKPSPDDEEQFRAAEKGYDEAKAAYGKKQDADGKKKLVDATVKFGTVAMTSNVLDRTEKYRKALSLYREALKLDPKNEEASGNTQLIVSIYEQMGRPVPQ